MQIVFLPTTYQQIPEYKEYKDNLFRAWQAVIFTSLVSISCDSCLGNIKTMIDVPDVWNQQRH